MNTNNILLKENFKQVCIWEGTIVGEKNIQEFKQYMLDKFNVRIQYLEEIETLPDGNDKPIPGTGGRIDLFFAIHKDDINKFAIPRLSYGIRWIEDVLSSTNYKYHIYPNRVSEYKNW